jgi:hypothetical protein
MIYMHAVDGDKRPEYTAQGCGVWVVVLDAVTFRVLTNLPPNGGASSPAFPKLKNRGQIPGQPPQENPFTQMEQQDIMRAFANG